MSKVIILRKIAADTYPVSANIIAATWLPGQCFCLNSTGTSAALASVDTTMFVGVDDYTECSTPPTGSLLTGLYGSGTKFIIDHSAEVAAGSASRAYSASGNPESAGYNADLYINTTGSWTTTATGSVKGKLFQIPTAQNNYGLGIILRF